MTLGHLLSIFPQARWRAPEVANREVATICFDSRKLASDSVFVAIRGSKVDGHKFLDDAAEAGAIAIVVEEEIVPSRFKGAIVRVDNSRDALNQLAARFYGQPSEKLFTVGVTGTNGKTTTTHMIEAILNAAGRPTGVIGTIDHHLMLSSGLKVWPTELTTPDPLEFQKRLFEFSEAGAKAVALEVSSIGLRQSRTDEVSFDAAVFTNLTRDHLDYHKDMEDYFQAKRRLFTELLEKSGKPRPTAIVNGDDSYGVRLVEDMRGKKATVWSYGIGNDLHLGFRVLEQGFFGTRFHMRTPVGEREFKIAMPGLHNVYNAAGAVGAALVAGVSLDSCARSLESLLGVKGRLEPVANDKGLFVFVDYAHTDDAIATVLRSLGKVREEAGLKNKIITVFGCGGDRDKGKRPLMMKAAMKGSDLVVVTSDNPRTEEPEAIIRDALAGVEAGALAKTVFSVTDRKLGIRKATELARPGDVIVIAGKGHEDYQIIGTLKHPFSDVEAVKEILA